ncbi:methionine biosynthesis protein MetW [Candidatus Lokiarchaeum ossiferum]|uniref:methionine biosynthesis protein MetW n=1 Tax=Candidatus Lokiarchaeum ossiferum TaxID=2951803 RepID=UPI00352E8A73
MNSEYRSIADIIPESSKVLDLGCGDGTLLEYLRREKKIVGTGIEISPKGVQNSISKGLSVIQGDLEEIIPNYSNNLFDFCILAQTLQELRNSDRVIQEMLRISKFTIIAFNNIVHFRNRLKILFQGKLPQTKELQYDWMNTNIMFLSVKDFEEYCFKKKIIIASKKFFSKDKIIKKWPNLRAKSCIFVINNIVD